MVLVLLDIYKFGVQKTIGGREIMNDIERRLNIRVTYTYCHIIFSLCTHYTYGLNCEIPFINWVDNMEGKTFPASSCHDTTDTKSAMKGGIPHFKTAEFPLITYSRPTSLLYGSCITKTYVVNLRLLFTQMKIIKLLVFEQL